MNLGRSAVLSGVLNALGLPEKTDSGVKAENIELIKSGEEDMLQRSSKSDESKKERITLSNKGRLINRRLVHQAQHHERADAEDRTAL
jgi:hypothetical protein